jgi:hypothetical protein
MARASVTGMPEQEETSMEKVKVKIRKLEKIETTIGRQETG